jgi:hypothetical protein
MTQRKPDRAERLVGKTSFGAFDGYGDAAGRCVTSEYAVKLLRQEHTWFRRMVKADPLFGAKNTEWKQGYTAALEAMLDRLTQRRK